MTEALGLETLNTLAAAGAYKELAAQIREAIAADREAVANSAGAERSEAETKLNAVRAGNTSGIANGTVTRNGTKVSSDWINAGS
jgi:hypothetical protein